jgi:fibronectin-binding autotransporter adhesin
VFCRSKLLRAGSSTRLVTALLAGTALAGALPLAALAQAWTGTTSADWYTAGNWSTSTVPTASTDVTDDTNSPNPAAINGGAAFTADLSVGGTGTAALSLQNLANLTSASGHVGDQAGAAGTLNVDGAGTLWTVNSDLVVGNLGSGALNVTNSGGVAVTGILYMGDQAGGNGAATTDGSGGGIDAEDLYVGVAGTATLTVKNSSVVGIAAAAEVGFGAGSTGTVTVTNATLDAQSLDVGVSGAGALTLQPGADVNVSGSMTVGEKAGSVGTVMIDGMASAANISIDGNLAVGGDGVGQGGTGSLSITNGGSIQFFSGNNVLTIGGSSGGVGTVTVDGALSGIQGVVTETIGDQGGTGVEVITHQASGEANTFVVGASTGSTGALTLDTGATFSTISATVGASGAGTLSVSGGAVFTASILSIAGNTGSTGKVTVTGAGSKVIGINDISIDGGTGSLSILAGGAASDIQGAVGSTAGGHATATVDGAGSTWTNQNSFSVATAGTGALTISNGGAVANLDAFIAGASGSVGAVTVTGAQSSWASSGALSVGFLGRGTLLIQNGGVVSDNSAVLGSSAGAEGDATVDGAGSTWTSQATTGSAPASAPQGRDRIPWRPGGAASRSGARPSAPRA